MTPFTDLYLRADNEQQANDALAAAGLHEHFSHPALEEGEPDVEGFAPAEGVSIDTIGIIYEPGTYDEEGNEVTAPVPLDGWHVNVRLREPLTEEQEAALGDAVIAEPSQPVRVWG